MKKITTLALAAGLASLAACNHSPREQAADNIEANADAMADNMEATADNMGDTAAANAMDNAADATRNTGEMKAKDMRTDDPDTNLANGI